MGNGRVTKSLLEQLPRSWPRPQAGGANPGTLESRHRVSLQTREWVLPSKDTAAADWIATAGRRAHLHGEGTQDWTNRLIYGDNLLAMAALLAGDEQTPSLRGKVDLIYIDPPFDSKADYRTKVTLPGVELEQRPTVIEQFAYSDMWADGTASYLAMITPRLVLMRELLSRYRIDLRAFGLACGPLRKVSDGRAIWKRKFHKRNRLEKITCTWRASKRDSGSDAGDLLLFDGNHTWEAPS